MSISVFEVVGPVLALWALVVAALGIRGHEFPDSLKLERLVAGISVVLVIVAVGSAIYSSKEEYKEKQKEKAKEASGALLAPGRS